MFTTARRKVDADIQIELSSGWQRLEVKDFSYEIATNEDEDVLAPGCTACGTLKCTVHGEFFESLSGCRISLNLSANDSGSVSVGYFFVTDHSCVKGSGVTKIEAADLMSKLDQIDYKMTDRTLEHYQTAHGLLMDITQLCDHINIYVDTGSALANYDVLTDIELLHNEIPRGYTCREMLGYIAGLYGMYAVDASHVYDHSKWSPATPNAIVLSDYNATGRNIPSSMIHQGGFELKERNSITTTPSVYVESYIESQITASSPQPDDVGYLMSPDDHEAILEIFKNYSDIDTRLSNTWIIFKRYGKFGVEDSWEHFDSEEGAPCYDIFYFFDEDAPNLRFNWDAVEDKLVFTKIGTIYRFRSNLGVKGKFYNYHQDTANLTCTSRGYDFTRQSSSGLATEAGVTTDNKRAVYSYEIYEEGQGVNQHQYWEIAASSFDVYDDLGNLLFPANASYVGMKRSGGEALHTIIYGSGDYTNPLITNYTIVDAIANQKAHTFCPGSVKWRGNPYIRAGTAITVTNRDGVSRPFLVCAERMEYDGGLVSTIECHGGSNTFNKVSGIRSQLKKARGMKKRYDMMNKQEVM